MCYQVPLQNRNSRLAYSLQLACALHLPDIDQVGRCWNPGMVGTKLSKQEFYFVKENYEIFSTAREKQGWATSRSY